MSKISVTSSKAVPGVSLTAEPFLEWAASILAPVLGFEEFHVLRLASERRNCDGKSTNKFREHIKLSTEIWSQVGWLTGSNLKRRLAMKAGVRS